MTQNAITSQSAADAYLPFDLPSRRMAGTYCFQSESGVVEVELVETSTLWRSLVYVRAGSDLTVFIPRGTYGMYLRAVKGGAARIIVRRMTARARLAFFAAKALRLLRRPPRDTLTIIIRLLRPGLRNGRIEASSLAPLVTAREAPAYVRPVIEAVSTPVPMAVSIIIPTKTRADLLAPCIASLDRIEGVTFEIIIVDNGADQPAMLALLKALAARSDTRIVRLDIPFNFSRLCNAGAVLARYDALLFLNDDVEALDGAWLAHMLGYLARPDTGATGARLLYPSGDLQHAGIASHLVPGPGHPFRAAPRSVWQVHPLLSQAGAVDAVTGACLLVKREIFERVHGFDETAFGVTLNDVDLCLRIRELGLNIIYVPQATLVHKESQSRRDERAPEEQERYRRELAAYYRRHPQAARQSCHYPPDLQRGTDSGLPIIEAGGNSDFAGE